MSNYIKTVNFATKDALPSGNAAKVVKGTEIDTEYNNIATAVATKQDTSGLGVANGYAPLDSGAKVPYANMQTDFTRLGVANTFSVVQNFAQGIGVQGAAGNNTAVLNSSGTVGSALGVLIRGGTNGSDYAFAVQNAPATLDYFRILGTGSFLFGNTTGNPTFSFLGTGTASFGGNANITGSLVASGNITCGTNFIGAAGGLTGIPAGQLTGSVPSAVLAAGSNTANSFLWGHGGTPTWSSIDFSNLTGSTSNAQVPVGVLTQYAGSAEFRNISAKNGHAKTLQAGGTASGGADGDIIYIY